VLANKIREFPKSERGLFGLDRKPRRFVHFKMSHLDRLSNLLITISNLRGMRDIEWLRGRWCASCLFRAEEVSALFWSIWTSNRLSCVHTGWLSTRFWIVSQINKGKLLMLHNCRRLRNFSLPYRSINCTKYADS
jgi:hypothetical protein